MRIFTTVLSFMLISLCTSVQAVEPVTDHQVMLYYYIPIGADNYEQKQHKFGLRFDRTMHDPREAVDISAVVNRPAMFDLQFQQKNRPLAFKVNGIDVTERIYVQRADTAEGEAAGAEAAMEEDAAAMKEEAAMEEATETEGEVAAEGETATETAATGGEKPEDKKAEKSVVEKTLDDLPFGVIMGVGIGIAIFAGAGG